MTDETIESVVEDQRATDPRLEQQAPAPQPPPEPDPAPEPEPATEPVGAADGGEDEQPDAEETPAVEEPKKKRSAEEVLKGRVGHLTKTLSAKDQALAEANRRAEAAEALLAAQGRAPAATEDAPPAPTPSPATVNPATGRTYTQAEFDQAVADKAQSDAFNRQADAMYDAGTKKFPDWKESVELLNATGLMSPVLLDAAMATDAGAEVIHHLGNDLDEAQRVLALSPVRMAAELSKMATKLTAPTKIAVSGAPAPIRPVSGAVNPQVDLSRVADTDDMRAYVATRAKQGSKWAQARARN